MKKSFLFALFCLVSLPCLAETPAAEEHPAAPAQKKFFPLARASVNRTPPRLTPRMDTIDSAHPAPPQAKTPVPASKDLLDTLAPEDGE